MRRGLDLHGAAPGEPGQALVVVLAMVLPLTAGIGLVMGAGRLVRERIKLQNAVDAAAVSAAVWQARGLNAVVYWNYALLAAAGGDLVKAALTGALDSQLYKTALTAQDTLVKVIPGNSAIRARQVFSENAPSGTMVEFPPGPGTYALRIQRKWLDVVVVRVPLWMEKDQPRYWRDQPRRGPFLRYAARRPAQPFPALGRWLGLEIPPLWVVAQAMPAHEGGDERGALAWLGGGLWDPSFAGRLVPVSVSLPGVAGAVLH